MEYKYFICFYSINSQTGATTFGNCEVTRSKEIVSYDDVKQIARDIGKGTNAKNENVVIINWKEVFNSK